MKKIFLLLLVLVVGVLPSIADTYTLDFAGSEDLYGLTRQKTHTANFQTDYEIVQNGIDFKFSTNSGAGFALTDLTAGTTSESQKKYMSGLMIATSGKVNVDVQVPGGKITGVKVIVSTISNTVEVPFTEYGETESTQNVTSEKVNNYKVYSWTWSNNDYTGDKVSFVVTGGMNATVATFFSYVRSIEVTYTPDLGGKLPPNLGFNESSKEGIVGEAFNAPTLSNPHNLPLIWTSSKESVATVNESGEVTLVGPGTATITVATDGDDNYGAGSAKYELTSIGVANNIPELLTNAPDINQQVKVNFPMTVTFANNSSVWVLDSEGNATKIVSTKNFESTETSASNVYEVGDIIPAGWMAINNSTEDCWQGLTGDATERAEVIYPEVESINWTDDAYKVVIIKNVTFTKFPDDLDGDTFTTQAGNSYKFINTFNIANPDAIGTFDVTVVVQNTRARKYLSIVNYAMKEKAVPAYPEAKDLVVEVNGEGSVTFDEGEEEIVVASKVADENAVITLTVPEGWDNFIYMDYSNPGVSPQAEEGEWMPVADLQATGMVLGNQITIPVKEEGVNAMYGVMLVLGDEAYMPASYRLNVSIEKSSTGPVSKTVTFDFVNENYGIKTTSYAEKAVLCEYEGITLTNGDESGTKYVNNSGLSVPSWPAFITVSAAGMPITNVTANASGTIKITYEDGSATVKNDGDLGQILTIKTLTVTYVDDGLESAGLKFPVASCNFIPGIDKGLELVNPNNVPVTYSSSNADVLVNENGEVSVAEGVNSGKATITASFEGNDTYRAAKVSYEITIVPCANTLAELKALKVNAYVNFESVVSYINGSWMFIQSLDGEAFTAFYQSSPTLIYKTGNVIPAGWIAKHTVSNGYSRYSMDSMPAAVEGRTEEPKIKSVTEITEADVTNVVILKNVVLSEEVWAAMPDAKTGTYTVTAGENTYDTYNQFKIAKPEKAGTYDLECGVILNTNKAIRLYPISYTAVEEKPVMPEVPTIGDLKVEVSGESTVEEYDDGEETPGLIITTEVEEEDATVTLTVPEGWDNFFIVNMSVAGAKRVAASDNEEDWMSVEGMEEGETYYVGNVITVPADGIPHQYGVTLVLNNRAYYAAPYLLGITATKKTVEPVSGTVSLDFVNETYGQERLSGTTSDYIDEGAVLEGTSPVVVTMKSALGAESKNESGSRFWNGGLRMYTGGTVVISPEEGYEITNVTFTSNSDSSFSLTPNDGEYIIAYTPTSSNKVLQTVTVEYAAVAPGKEPAGLSFEQASYTVGNVEKFFNGAVLNNPHELPVKWSSSNEAVATITEIGAVKIEGVGTTVITVISDETDEYAQGKASYTLTVVSAAVTIEAMKEAAPNLKDEVLVETPLYVQYANGNYVYVTDIWGDATLLYGSNNYKAGDVIPRGWIAKNATYQDNLEWNAVSGLFPESTENNELYVEIPEVENVTLDDLNRVVTLKNVKFSDETPADKMAFTASLSDGSEIALYNQFEIAAQAAGTYDLVAAVWNRNNAVQLYPIEYKEVSESLVYPESLEIETSAEANITQKIAAADGSLQITIIADKVPADTFTATLGIPEGWTGLMISNDFEDDGVIITDGSISPLMRVNAASWVPVGQLSMMFTEGNSITVPVTKVYNESNTSYDKYNNMYVLLVKDGMADYANQIELNIRVNQSEIVGIDSISAEEEGVEYYTLDGVQVKNPGKGIYVKVVNGKATKEVRK